MISQIASLALCLLPLVAGAPAEERAIIPTVQLQFANVVGTSLLGVDSFRGIPYAQPPVGNLRLKAPQPITSNQGTILATGIPRACPQFNSQVNTGSLPSDALNTLLNTPFAQTISNAGEDCLTVNVQRPSTATSSSKLPVVFWIYGGGFQFGSTQTYDGSELVTTSVAEGKSVIYVSVNYRVGAFGFLNGKEVLAGGVSNLGLLDQRLGLQWVADNIAAFGGDPTKVTIWGESAGAISVFDQMALYGGDNTYKGKPLFRGAIMDSGSIVPADPVDCPKAQVVYNKVVQNAGCSAAADTLECLRGVDYTTFLNAANSVPAISGYNGIALSYLPRPDGTVLTASPDVLAQKGQYASVPFIIGDQEDEGTLFSLSQSNLTTEADLVDYLHNVVFNAATRAQVQGFVDTYPTDPSAGSPFRTGLLNQVYPQYKRLAAMQGDFVFTLTRRVFLSLASAAKPSVPSYSYLSSYFYGTPVLGTFHASDILPAYGITPGIPSSSIQAYYLSFINTLNPNSGTSILLPQWPQWSAGNNLLSFAALTNSLIPDNFRQSSYMYLRSMTNSFRV